LYLWCARLDHSRRAFGGLYDCVKFGWNRCGSFDDMQILIFCELSLKTPIHAPKIGVLGDKIGEGVVRFWPQRTRSYFWGVVTSVSLLAVIGQEMRPWKWTDSRQTDGHKHWLTLCRRTTVVHSTALNSSDNLPCYPPDNHRSSDVVY